MQVEYKWDQKPYINMMSNRYLLNRYIQNAESLGLEFCHDDAILSLPKGSTDMGNVSHEVASIHPHYYIGTRVSEHTPVFQQYSGKW